MRNHNSTVRVYREDFDADRGRWSKPKPVSGSESTGPGSAQQAAEWEAMQAASAANFDIERHRDSAGCSLYVLTDRSGATVARYFYWYIGRNNDARGYLKDRDPNRP